MDFALVYLAHRFVYRVLDFFHHWYVDGSHVFLRRFVTVFTGLEQSFAIRTTLTHFFEPLYKDYSMVGRILGIPFRVGRVLLGGAFYALFVMVFAAVYVVWLAAPLACFVLASENIPPGALMEQLVASGRNVVLWVISSFKPPALPL